jgi:type III pantothenate kinase
LYGGPACGRLRHGDDLDASAGGTIWEGDRPGIGTQPMPFPTDKLLRVISAPPAPIGRNTVHAIQSGLLFGYVGLVEGMVERFRKELGPEMKVIGTGGLVELIAAETDVIQFKAPWLTLDGLRLVWEMNRS